MDYQEAISYWERKDAKSAQMNEQALLKEIEKFIAAHNTCALATGDGKFIRCTPIEYSYYLGSFWMLSEGGLKFKGLENNPNVSIAVFDQFAGFEKLGGLQVTGRAEIVEPWSKQYVEILDLKKIPKEGLKKLRHPLHLICIVPTQFDFLFSGLKALGYSARQHLTLNK